MSQTKNPTRIVQSMIPIRCEDFLADKLRQGSDIRVTQKLSEAGFETMLRRILEDARVSATLS